MATAQAYLAAERFDNSIERPLLEKIDVLCHSSPISAASLRFLSQSHIVVNLSQSTITNIIAPRLNSQESKQVLDFLPKHKRRGIIERLFDFGSSIISTALSFWKEVEDHLTPEQKLIYAYRHNKSHLIIEDNEWWSLCSNTLSDIAPNQLAFFWERAGGRHKHLQERGSFQEKWHQAIQTIRQGGEPHIQDLLSAVQHEYSNGLSGEKLAALIFYMPYNVRKK